MSTKHETQERTELVRDLNKLAEYLENSELGLYTYALDVRKAAALLADDKAGVEPVMIYHGRHTIDCGEFGSHDMEMLKLIPAGTLLYTRPQQAAQVAQPLTQEQREQISAKWRGRNWTLGDIIAAVEAAHGIGKDQAS